MSNDDGFRVLSARRTPQQRLPKPIIVQDDSTNVYLVLADPMCVLFTGVYLESQTSASFMLAGIRLDLENDSHVALMLAFWMGREKEAFDKTKHQNTSSSRESDKTLEQTWINVYDKTRDNGDNDSSMFLRVQTSTLIQNFIDRRQTHNDITKVLNDAVRQFWTPRERMQATDIDLDLYIDVSDSAQAVAAPDELFRIYNRNNSINPKTLTLSAKQIEATSVVLSRGRAAMLRKADSYLLKISTPNFSAGADDDDDNSIYNTTKPAQLAIDYSYYFDCICESRTFVEVWRTLTDPVYSVKT